MPFRVQASRLSSLGLARTTRPLAHPPRPPEGPSCSRWISCTCCRQSDSTLSSRATYFSHNNANTTGTTRRPPLTSKDRPALSPSHARDNIPRLPLPPTLPYSPDSVPFKRHLEYLSLSVVSSLPEASWRTYLALHPSLRRYIPDDLFRQLLSHQLTDEYPTQRWIRSLALVKFAKRCGVSAKELGEENLKKVFEAGLTYVLRTKTSELDNYQLDIAALWQQVRGCREVPVAMRRGWLQSHIKRRVGKRSRRIKEADAALRETVDLFGIKGLEKEAGRIVSMYKGSDVGVHLESLERAAWCAGQGVILVQDTMLVMLQLVEIWEDEGVDAVAELLSKVGALPVSAAGARHLDRVLADVRYRFRHPAQRLVDAISTQKSIAHVTRLTLEVLGTDSPDMETALAGLSDLLKRDADVEVVMSGILQHLSRTDPTLVLRLANLIVEHDTLSHLRDTTIHGLFRLLISCLPSEEAYSLVRKVYPIARTRSFRWLHRSDWEILYHHALDLSRRHLHFASRLYADYQADKREILPVDMYAMIRAVGMSRSASRAVLLERYIHDFLESKNAIEPFVLAMVHGLTSSKNASDASLALDLSRRILQDHPIPPLVADLVIDRLAASPNFGHLRQAVHLLDSTTSPQAYNNVLFAIIAHSRTDPKQGQMSRTEALGQAVEIYKRMVQQRIAVTSRTISLLLRALVDARYVTSALATFRAALDNAFVLKPNSVGRLMVRLVLDGRYDEADAVERKWRQADLGIGQRYDRAIVGARVLLDTKMGREVDMAKIAKETGWSGTAPFLRFVQSLQPRDQAQTARDPAEAVDDEMRDVEDARPAVAGPQAPPWRSGRSEKGYSVDSIAGVRLE